MAITPASRIPPRETTILKIGAADVKTAFEALRTAIASAKGRTTRAELNEPDRHNVTAELHFDIPRTEEGAFKRELERAGETRASKIVRQQETNSVTDTKVGYQLEIVPASRSDEGLLPQIGSGLSFSLRGLFISLNYLLLGVLFVLPWLLLAAVVFWVVRRVLGAAKK